MSTELMKIESDGLGQELLARREDFARSFGDAIQAEKFIQDAYSAINANPKLRSCTPESLFGALFFAAQIGLPVGGPMAQFHLTVRTVWNEIQRAKVATVVPIIGYNGLIRLAMNSGEYDTIGGIVVYANDEFVKPWADEQGKHFKHVPSEGDPGEIIGVVGYATVRGAQRSELEWVSIEKVLREHAPKDFGKTPWATNFASMVQKTGVRMVSKYTTKTSAAEKFALAVGADQAIVTVNPLGELEIDHQPQATEDWATLIPATDDKADLQDLWKRIGQQEAPQVAESFAATIAAHAATLTKDSRPAEQRPSATEQDAANLGRSAASPQPEPGVAPPQEPSPVEPEPVTVEPDEPEESEEERYERIERTEFDRYQAQQANS